MAPEFRAEMKMSLLKSRIWKEREDESVVFCCGPHPFLVDLCYICLAVGGRGGMPDAGFKYISPFLKVQLSSLHLSFLPSLFTFK